MREHTISSCLSREPLTDRELRDGAFLRVARCLRSDEGTFGEGPVSHLWSVLSGRRDGAPRPPRCIGLEDGRRAVRGVRLLRPTPLASRRAELAGEAWTVDEYSLLVPDRCERLLLKAGPSLVKVGRSMRRNLLDEYYRAISNASVDPRYEEWLARENERALARPVPESDLLMSVVTPVFRTQPDLLREMIGSVLAQTYPHWELVIVNASPEDEGVRGVLAGVGDPRVRVIACPENLGIASNTRVGVEAARGDYVCLVDHDDVIEPQALAEYVRAIEEGGRAAGLVYCDEDNLDESGRHLLPVMKPPRSPELLLSNNYVIHMLAVRRDLYLAAEPSPADVDGAQDYDLTLKLFETEAPVARVPHVLYHWRMCAGSTAADPASKRYAQRAGALALARHLDRTGARGEVSDEPAPFTYRVSFKQPNPLPPLTVLSEGVSSQTEEALRSHAARSGGVTYEPRGAAALAELVAGRAGRPGPLVLLVSPEHDLAGPALEELVATVSRPGVLAASPRVVRADGLLEFAGALVRPDGSLARLSHLLPSRDEGYLGRTVRPYDCLALDHECCLLDLSKLPAGTRGGDFEGLAHELADVLAQGREAGLRAAYTPYAAARLNAPRTLLDEEPSPGELRDRALLLERHPQLAEGDPTHSPSLDPWDLYYKLNW